MIQIYGVIVVLGFFLIKGAWAEDTPAPPILEPSLDANILGLWRSCITASAPGEEGALEVVSLDRVWRIEPGVWHESRTYIRSPDCRGEVLLEIQSQSPFTIIRPLYIWDGEDVGPVPALVARIGPATHMEVGAPGPLSGNLPSLQDAIQLSQTRYKVLHWKKSPLSETIREGLWEESITFEVRSPTAKLDYLEPGFVRACMEAMYQPDKWLYELKKTECPQWPSVTPFLNSEDPGPYTHTLRQLPQRLLPSLYAYVKIGPALLMPAAEKTPNSFKAQP